MNIFKNHAFLICLLLTVVTLAIYVQVGSHDFINYDDNVYITDNPHVTSGLTLDNIRWAFTTGYAVNWHPLTWVSHMIDVELFGLNPGSHHLAGVFFHILNTILLLLVLKWMTGKLWQSAFVAALFALHPFHVESVAWASERKDLVSTLFWILSMWAYVVYVEKRGALRYLLVLFFFALGLMSKPMLVTLPFVLLLLDFWPLRRFETGDVEEKKKGKTRRRPESRIFWKQAFRLVQEKVPMFGLVVISSMVTYMVQQSVAMTFGGQFSLPIRIGNALLSYVAYIGKTFWPDDLALLYVHRAMTRDWQVVMIPMWKMATAAVALVLVSIAVLRKARRYPHLTVGWFWYVGTLVPVIGLVQVGEQAMADRYTYVPLIGLFIMIAWGGEALLKRFRIKKAPAFVLAGLVLAVLSLVSWRQIGYWRNSVTIFENTIRATDVNPVAHYNLAYALHMQGKVSEALPHYEEALRIVPFYKEAYTMYSLALQTQGENTRLGEAKSNYGTSLGKQGRFAEAEALLNEALRLNPTLVDAYSNLGIVLAMQGKMQEARYYFTEAIRLNPNHSTAHYNLGLVLAAEGNLKQAISHYTEALRLNPGYADARTALIRAQQTLR